MTPVTPMLAQYQDMKKKYEGMLLLFRLGDFYELFFEDAVIASRELDITLTRRGQHKGQDIPMCGVPYHASENYIARLIKKGHKVAICEQMESPEEAKKRGAKSVVKRDVVRILTPGTLTEDTLLDQKSHNYLMAISQVNKGLGLSVIDISTGDFATESISIERLPEALEKFSPSEILMPERLSHDPQIYGLFQERKRFLSLQANSRFDFKNAEERIKSLCGGVLSLEVFGSFTPAEISAAGAILDYVTLTQKANTPRIKPPQKILAQESVLMDASTRLNLELTHTLSGKYEGSLLHAIDETLTAGGGRLLHQRLSSPLTCLESILKRLDQVEWFMPFYEPVRAHLKGLPDLARILNRVALNRAGPRDFISIRSTLTLTQMILDFLDPLDKTSAVNELFQPLDPHVDLKQFLTQAMMDDVPLLARDGQFIAEGFDTDLDAWRRLRDEGRQTIATLQASYIQQTGISSLKIKYNNVLGYFVEVSPQHKDRMPETLFMHRQTLGSAMRYTSVELSDLEQKLLQAGDECLKIELRIFEDIRQKILCHFDALHALSQGLSALDVTAAAAYVAIVMNLKRPTLVNKSVFNIKGGRHPVVEKALGQRQASFAPNDCELSEDKYLWMLTGPNMAGKSTFLRQNALILIMAQMGFFVPATRAEIGLTDRIFSRVGASDDLAQGRSTFMVEMIETAAILNQATEKSFVILDEIGRGTATYDGMALAWAVVEYLHNQIRVRGLFATHYHELTDLVKSLPHLVNYTMAVQEFDGKIVFLHQVRPGVANRSYGIHVAALAGLPPPVLKRAENLLERFESRDNDLTALPLFKSENMVKERMPSNKALEAIQAIDPDSITAKDALDLVYKLKQIISS